MDGWVLGAALSVFCTVAVVLHVLGKPVVRSVVVLAWASAVFTADTALGGTGVERGELTVPKLAPLAVLLAAAAVFLLAPRRSRRPVLTPPLWWMSGYLLWLAIAAVFDGDPVSGLLRVIQFSIPPVVMVATRRRTDSRGPFLVGTVAAAATHVLYAVLLHPHYVGPAGQQRLTGLLIANAFGLAAGLALIGAFGLWLTGRRRGAWVGLWLLMGASVYGLVQSAARTAAIAVLVALPAALWAALRDRPAEIWRKATLLTAVVVAGLVYVVVDPRLVGTAAETFTRGNDDLTNLTGRLPLWSNLLVAVAHRPLLGFGPSAYRAGSVDLGAYLTAPQLSLAGAHNSLLEAVVEGGLPAGVLWLSMMVTLGVHVWRSRGPMRPMALGLYVFSCVSTITGTNATGIGMGWFLIVALAALPVGGPLPDNPVGIGAAERPADDPQAPPGSPRRSAAIAGRPVAV